MRLEANARQRDAPSGAKVFGTSFWRSTPGHITSRHTPRRRGIQYAAASRFKTSCSGILDHPPSRGDDRNGWIDSARKGSNRTTALFDNLSERLGGILDRLTGRGALTEKDVDAAMREVRRALLEADVALEVVRDFTDRVREQAVGATVVKSVTPGQMVVKIVHDELINTLGADGEAIDLNAVPPVAIMMVGLQGSGKTTTTAKLARRLVQRDKRKVLMASLDIYRPAAMEQLAVLGRDLDIPTLPIVAGQKPAQIAKRALEAGKLGGYDVVLLD